MDMHCMDKVYPEGLRKGKMGTYRQVSPDLGLTARKSRCPRGGLEYWQSLNANSLHKVRVLEIGLRGDLD